MASRIFVGNLPRSATEAVLGNFFTEAGFRVTSAMVIHDRVTGGSRGFGFVELAEDEDLQRAIAGLNGRTLDGRKLTVNEARPPQGGWPQSGADQRGRYARHF